MSRRIVRFPFSPQENRTFFWGFFLIRLRPQSKKIIVAETIQTERSISKAHVRIWRDKKTICAKSLDTNLLRRKFSVRLNLKYTYSPLPKIIGQIRMYQWVVDICNLSVQPTEIPFLNIIATPPLTYPTAVGRRSVRRCVPLSTVESHHRQDHSPTRRLLKTLPHSHPTRRRGGPLGPVLRGQIL